jgi:phosphoglycerate dehydrogenase-like enzyme
MPAHTVPCGAEDRVRVAVLDDYQGVALDYADWGRLGPGVEVTVFRDHLAGRDDLVARLHGFDVVVLMRERTPVPAALLRALPRLRLLVTTGMANAAVDVAEAARRGVTVCGTAGDLQGTVELTWGLVLALLRQIPREDAAVRRGAWQETVGRNLAGGTLGVVGLGRIGRRVAAIAHAFDMRVLAWSANLTADAAARAGAELVDKAELFARSDVVTLHLQLSPRTAGIVGRPELDLMKPTAHLVNTSRGPLVDEAALARALHDGRIAGAGLDVFGEEPLPPGHPLLTAPRTVLTPHLGYVTETNFRTYFPDVVEDIGAFLAGRPVRVLASPDRP